ncbi:hypothetical protein ABZ639_24450 [Saccharomonospora sp. NPDC006951]
MNSGQQQQPPPRPMPQQHPQQPPPQQYQQQQQAPPQHQQARPAAPPHTPPHGVQAPGQQQGSNVIGAAAPPRSQQQGGAQHQHVGNELAMATTAEVARPQPLAVSAPAGMPPAPGGPAPVEDPQGSSRQHRDWRLRKHRAMPRLRIGQHHAPEEALEQLQMVGGTFGFQLGRNQSGFPVTLTLFRPRPVRAYLIGGLWAARLMALRALRFGVRVVVSTHQPEGWAALGRSVTGRSDRVIVLDHGEASDVVASPGAPVLRLHDAPHPAAAEEPTPWQTQMTVIRRLGPEGMQALPHADIVLAQRLTANEAMVAASALRLSQNITRQLQALRDDMMASLTHTERTVFWLSAVPFERERLGNPVRH